MARYEDIPQFIQAPPGGAFSLAWSQLEYWIARISGDYGLDLDPDFQRAHVWTQDQQIAYVEYILKGGDTAKQLYFNSPAYGARIHIPKNADLGEKLIIVDGKQRLEAVRAFLRDDIPACGYLRSEYNRDPDWIRHQFVVSVNTLCYRRDLLRWYLQINDTGVHHTPEDLDKVRRLLEVEENGYV